ncbi:hypothetical protein OH687_30375 [Burkholderia anthina]|nr:hypothetical protein OH687_30375 [Burkholderia anthina]
MAMELTEERCAPLRLVDVRRRARCRRTGIRGNANAGGSDSG